MSELKIVRDDTNRWILQKNISKKDLFLEFLRTLDELKNEIDYSKILNKSQTRFSYEGRSIEGSESTMGVRMSEVNFYMFGYKSPFSNEFIPSPISKEFLTGNIKEEELFLANIAMMQFPHPNSKTHRSVDLFFGRLILKLLRDERLSYKLYSDELVFILPFVTKINKEIYEELIAEIMIYRKKSYQEKKELFESVPNYEALFAKITHEVLYYLVRIYENFDIIDTFTDPNHNDGQLFKFQQGQTPTFRRTAIQKNKKNQGYIKLRREIIDLVDKILTKFPFDAPTYKLGFNGINSEEELFNDMFVVQSYNLLNVISPTKYLINDVVEKLDNMRETSINSPDGKDFELSLASVFKEFDEAHAVNVLSGAGKTDIFCVFMIDNKLERFNVEAKSGSSGNNVNVIRILRHMENTNAEYCLMIAPRFSRGTYLDIDSTKISTMTTETLYQYCMRMLTQSEYRHLPYYFIHELIQQNPGSRLDFLIENLLTEHISFN